MKVLNMAEWTIKFKDNSFFRLDKNKYYIKKMGRGLRNIDYCYFTGKTLDFIECKEVNNPLNEKLDCALKGVHSLALVKTGLLENNKQFSAGINKLQIPKDIKINVYFVFKADYEQTAQLNSIEPFIVKNIKSFSLLWNINEILVMTYEQAKENLNYIKCDK